MIVTAKNLLAAFALVSHAAFAAGHAHVHGIAKLDIAVDAGSLVVQFESPLDNLLGFERAPRTDAERRQVDTALARLKSPVMFSIDPAAQCQLDRAELSSSALKLGHPDPKEEEQGHADIDGRFEFSCLNAHKATYVDVGLFGFDHLQQLEVQVATPHGQFRRDLKRPAHRIELTK